MRINYLSKPHLMRFVPVLALLMGLVWNNIHEVPVPEKASNDSNHSSLIDTVSDRAKKIFTTACYSCHKDSVSSLAPGITIISSMTPHAVFNSLQKGKMRVQAAALSDSDKKILAEWLTGRKMVETKIPKTAFTNFAIRSDIPSAYDHSGWGNSTSATGFRNTAQAGISLSNLSSIRLKWSFAFPQATIMRTKPAVIDNWIIVGGQYGDVYALNRHTGKIGWVFTASAAIRGAITVVRRGKSITAYFADFSTNTYAIDVRTGKQLWNKRAGYEQLSSTTGSVAVYNGKIYVPITSLEVSSAAAGNYDCCFSSGGVVALDAATGKKLWQYRTIPGKAKAQGKKRNGKPFYGPSGAPVWSSPTIDTKRGVLYIGTGENYSNPTTSSSDAIQALDLKTGKLVWNFQATENDAYNTACPILTNCPEKSGPDLDFGMSPMLVTQKNGKDILIAGQKSGVVFGISPDNGKMLWQSRVGKGGMLGGIHWGMASDGINAYAANADNTIAIDKRDTAAKQSPGMYAVNLENGNIIWNTPTPAATGYFKIAANSAAPVAIPGIVFAGSLDGHIRAYSTENGKILWDYNTAIDFETVNGIKGKGGSIDGPPPVVANGMLFVNSGYGMFGQMGGNVLLAFEVSK